jgi:hypothetical protein
MKNSQAHQPLRSMENPKPTPEWLHAYRHLEKVKTLCQDHADSFQARKSTLSELWSSSLFLRSTVAVQAAMLIFNHGLNDDASNIIRSLFEIQLQLGAINAEPATAFRLMQDTEGRRLKRLKALRDSGVELPSDFSATDLANEIAQMEKEKTGREIKKRELAENAGLLNEYTMVYSLLSDITHVSPTGLANYFEGDLENRKVILNANTSALSAEYLMAMAAAIQLNILVLAAKILQDELPSQVTELNQETRTLLQARAIVSEESRA